MYQDVRCLMSLRLRAKIFSAAKLLLEKKTQTNTFAYKIIVFMLHNISHVASLSELGHRNRILLEDITGN